MLSSWSFKSLSRGLKASCNTLPSWSIFPFSSRFNRFIMPRKEYHCHYFDTRLFFSVLCMQTQLLPLKQSGVSALSWLLLILSSSRDGGSAGILVSWLPSRFSFFRKVKFYMTRSKKEGCTGQRDKKQTKWILIENP